MTARGLLVALAASLFVACAGGDDAVRCTDSCQTAGSTECSGDGVVTCRPGADGCRAWSAVVSCAGDEACSDGACHPRCRDACQQGATACFGEELQTCRLASDGCLEWSEPATCANGGRCEDDSCLAACTDACEPNEQRCDGALVESCERGEDDCLRWSEPATCPASGFTCRSGACRAACASDCDTEGEGECVAGGRRVCTEVAPGCLQWSTPTACAAGEDCTDGGCAPCRPCGELTYAGECVDGALWWCNGACAEQETCATGTHCAFFDDDYGYACVAGVGARCDPAFGTPGAAATAVGCDPSVSECVADVCRALPPGATCAAPLEVDLTGASASVTLSAQDLNAGRADLPWPNGNSCSDATLPGGGLYPDAPYAGGDLFYAVDLPAGSSLDVATTGVADGLDLALFAYDPATTACDELSSVACLAASDVELGGAPDNGEWLAVDRCAQGRPTRVMVVAAGWAGAPDGSFGLTFRRVACGDPCGGVPAEGRCSSGGLTSCLAPAGGGVRTLATYACPANEVCSVAGGAPACVATGACDDGDTACADASDVKVCANGAWSAPTACPAGCLSTPLGDACAAAVPTRVVTGAVAYERRDPDDDFTDWGPLHAVPAAGFVVASVHAGALVDATVTSADASSAGAFSLHVPATPDAGDSIQLFPLGADADGTRFAVADPAFASPGEEPVDTATASPHLWHWAFPVPGPGSAASLTVTDAMGSGAARMFEALRSVRAAVRADFPGRRVPSTVMWLGEGTTWDCGSCFGGEPLDVAGFPFDSQVWIGGDADEGYWSAAVLAHELGHFVMWANGTPPGEGGPHFLEVPTLPGQAWSEGFATWFSSDFRADPRYFDKQQGTFFWADLSQLTFSDGEAFPSPDPTGGLLQPMDENALASMLWSLDGAHGKAPLLATLAGSHMNTSPFPRGYTRHTWDTDSNGVRTNVVDTGESAPCLADFLDALDCGGFPRADLDAATRPSSRFPYPSAAPLCGP